MQRTLKEKPGQDMQNELKQYLRSRQDEEEGTMMDQRKGTALVDKEWKTKNLRGLVAV